MMIGEKSPVFEDPKRKSVTQPEVQTQPKGRSEPTSITRGSLHDVSEGSKDHQPTQAKRLPPRQPSESELQEDYTSPVARIPSGVTIKTQILCVNIVNFRETLERVSACNL